MDTDLVAIVEAAYAVAPTDADWLAGVVRAASPGLDRGGGVHGYLVDMRSDDRPLREPLLVGGPSAWRRTWRKTWWEPFMGSMSPAHVRLVHSLTAVCYTTDLFAAAASHAPSYDEYLSMVASRHWGTSRVLRGARAAQGVGLFPDSFNVACIDAEERGCVLVANLADPSARPVARGLARTWAKVAAHVATGYRLHRQARSSDAFAGAEAILDPSGRAVHAAGPAAHRWALDAIRGAAASIDRARTRAVRRDATRALDAWRALASGRWTILDCFDRDGRRFIVARPNEPAASAEPKLTRRQAQIVACVALGHGNKLIAYELGLGVSTVAAHVAAAARKLGARTRVELILRARDVVSRQGGSTGS
jgi:DNA-binding CsgD family transcriptional regulator